MFCKNCGAELPKDGKFCENCGYAMNEENQAEHISVADESIKHNDNLPSVNSETMSSVHIEAEVIDEPKKLSLRQIITSKSFICKTAVIVCIIAAVFGCYMTKLHIDNKKAAESVQAQIEAIQNVSLSNKNELDTAKNSYDALTERQKSMVTNYSKLEDDIARYNKLEVTSYKVNLSGILGMIMGAADNSNYILNTYTNILSEANSALLSGNYNYSQAQSYIGNKINETFTDTEVLVKFMILETYHPQIEENVKNIETPPDSCKDMYDAIIALYDAYSSLYDITINPAYVNGDFSENVSERQDTYNIALTKIKEFFPENFE